MRNYKPIITFATLVFLGATSSIKAYAQAPAIEIEPVGGFASLQDALNTLIPAILFVGGFLCFGYLLFGAYKYITAGDNASNTEGARKTMINAVIGIALLGLVFVIFKVATEIIGIDGWFFGGSAGIPSDCSSQPNGPC